MTARSHHKSNRPESYPLEEAVRHGCQIYASVEPGIVYRTCCVKLHDPSQRKRAALLEVFTNNTLAAAWMLRDIEQHDPERLFAKYRKGSSWRYYTKGIAQELDARYRQKIRGRYALNTHLFGGLCSTLAAILSAWLHKMSEAQQKGDLQRYEESSQYVVDIGKHAGRTLASLGRKTIFGYAFLMPKPEEIHEALSHLNALLSNGVDDDAQRAQAERYQMRFGPRRGKALGTMQLETLRRLRLLVIREAERVDQLGRLREAAQAYLRFTPPGFPRLRSDGLSPGRRREMITAYLDALESYGSLRTIGEGNPSFTENERALFAELQKRAYAATQGPTYLPLRWKRADGCVKKRDMGLAYDTAKWRYLLLAYILADRSRHRRVLKVTGEVYDVNNPSVRLSSGKKPSIAMLFELECGQKQQEMLDQARLNAALWKAGQTTTSGCIRSATLHAHWDEEGKEWWFEAQIAVARKPTLVEVPEHVVGVHIDPQTGIFVSVLTLRGQLYAQHHLDEATIARLLENHPSQALIPPLLRTRKERYHRIADALLAISVEYRAQLGIEDISYRHETLGPQRTYRSTATTSSLTVVELMCYKLPLVCLPKPIKIFGVSPRRDCGVCGARLEALSRHSDVFTCASCGYQDERHFNTAREVARRTLWMVSQR